MSTRSAERAARAEARRRARQVARGDFPAEPDTDDVPADEPRPNLLQRLFPPAPALPGKGDPLAGFDTSGPLRSIRERLFLLRRYPFYWVLPGLTAFIGYMASIFYGSSVLSLVGTFVLFGSLIAAGWFGWPRPALFGTSAALISYVLATSLVLYTFASQGAGPDTFGSAGQVIGRLLFDAAYQAGMGFLGGWYGGYLRRRQTHLGAEARTRRR